MAIYCEPAWKKLEFLAALHTGILLCAYVYHVLIKYKKNKRGNMCICTQSVTQHKHANNSLTVYQY